MSPSRGTVGEVSWSDCSAEFIGGLDMECLKDRFEHFIRFSF